MAPSDSFAQESRLPAWDKHVDYIIGDSPRRVRGQAIMRRGGMPVWAVMSFYFLFGENRTETLSAYPSQLTAEELDAALAFYQDHPDAINEKLHELAT